MADPDGMLRTVDLSITEPFQAALAEPDGRQPVTGAAYAVERIVDVTGKTLPIIGGCSSG
jgi:hypothetical protein